MAIAGAASIRVETVNRQAQVNERAFIGGASGNGMRRD
jgi:hypothetical protein